ncbi:MAG: Ig-like domain-containing protein [Eubacterium sp.]|nr:Ig-like domain-containing protein [Eubacterium sp.]
MKLTKQLAALALAVLMALLTPVIAIAETQDPGFTLTTVQTTLFAGLSYDVTATITDASEADATGNNYFTWNVVTTGGEAPLSTLDNYKATKNSDGTYTVTETASITMPPAGSVATVTATLGSRSKSISLSSLQPIDAFDVNFVNSDHAYLDTNATIHTLYVDRAANATSTAEFADFSIENITPSVNDDEIYVATAGINKDYINISNNENRYTLSLTNKASGLGSMNFSVLSGNKSFKNYNIQVCIAATEYKLDVKGFKQTSYANYGKTGATEPYTLTNLYTGKTFAIRASGDYIGNDDIRYELYTDSTLQTKAPDNYVHVKNNREIELTIAQQGTYWLVSKNYSMNNGMLKRDLNPVVTKLVVNQSITADSINLYQLDENNVKTDEKLEDITLYTNTLTTYELSKNITVLPENRTDGLEFSSSNTAAATVDANGKITAKAKGDAVIYIKSDENANANTSVNVHVKIGVKSITNIVKQDNTTIIPSGHVQKLIITTNPTVIDEPIYWSSTNRDVLSVDRLTGVITAGEVTENTIVTINAISETGLRKDIMITVVPANRAESLTLSATSESATYSEKEGTAYRTYCDYYQSTASKRTTFTVTADAPGSNGEQTNDEYVWTVSYNNGIGLSFEEAKAEGLITYNNVDGHRVYLVTPQKQGVYVITCTATTNITAPQSNDPTDTIIIDILQTATTLTVKNAGTDTSTPDSVYIPIGTTREITVKSSTPDNDKHIDPPVYKISQGAEYVNVTEKASDDGEGVTYTIEGLSYGFEATKLVFSSKSGSKSRTITFYIRNNIGDADISGLEESYEYTGSEIKPQFDVIYNGSKIESSLYSVSYNKTNTNVGTCTMTITGKGEYNGSVKTVTFRITPKPFDDTLTFSSISDQGLSMTKREALPTPSVKFNNRTLTKDKDYVISYKNNKAAGTATLTVNGIGNYKGSASTTFKVIDTVEMFRIASIPVKVYTGKEIKPLPKITYNGVTLKKDVDYTLTYSNNINPGKAYITLKGIGKFAGTSYIYYKIKPKKMSAPKLTKGSKQIAVSYTSQPGVSGYQIRYALNKKFTKKKKNYVTIYSSTTLTGLKGKAKYYVKVRAYKEIDGVKYYGAWSKIKTIKTLK